MRYISYSLLICLLSTALVSAQLCPTVDEQLANLFDDCADPSLDSLCTQGDVTIEHDDSEIESLSNIITLTTTEESSTMLRLNREDHPLYIITLGDLTLENTAPRTEITVTATRNVNVRRVPSVDATVIGSLTIRQEYTAIGRLSDNTWIRVRLDDGRIGWASAQFFVTSEGFTALEATTPNTPPYLPMQSVTVNTSDCGLTLLMGTQPEIAEDSDELAPEPIIFGINGAQITVNGIVAISTQEDTLHITSITGEHTVNAFGFEIDLTDNQVTTIPLSSENTIASIPTDAEDSDPILDEASIDALLDELEN